MPRYVEECWITIVATVIAGPRISSTSPTTRATRSRPSTVLSRTIPTPTT